MAAEPEVNAEDWPRNYFNYFTEIESRFQQARGSGFFLLSPLDWALIESWKEAGVPLEAVLRGIDSAFEKWRARKKRSQAVNSLAYCSHAVAHEAEALVKAGLSGAAKEASAPFSLDDLREYLESNARHLESIGHYAALADPIRRMLGALDEHYANLEELERQLSTLEQKTIAIARSLESEETALAARRELDLQLRSYRSKMTTAQLSLLERQFLDRRTLESAGLRRLSLFYLGA